MVQSLVAPEGDFDAEKLWKEISPEQMMDSKLKCVFELPIDNNTVVDLSSQMIKNAGKFNPGIYLFQVWSKSFNIL